MHPTPDLAIRLQRAAFNRALAEGDLSAIKPLLAENVVLVTGTDSALLFGRKAQLGAWKQEFASTQRTVYVRTPDRIEPSNVEPIAMEYGHWQGLTQGATDASGTVLASGTYVAKWRESGGNWIIEAEIYLTLA